jgi:4-diphosphocytidyl-2-C-methyl-D-erythritol kinase
MLIYPSPAKINLTLKILGKRPDGFHELETLMVPISLHDILTLTPTLRPTIELTCTDPTLPTDSRNLAYQAAQLFFNHTTIKAGIHIHIDKKIPHGGGLGGGSSNAATTLRALRDYYAPHISNDSLYQWIASLGSDIPFFINPRPSLCTGKGDIITPHPLPTSTTLHAILIFPPFGIPTPWAYKTYAQAPSMGEESHRWGIIPLRNDLEPAVFSKYIILKTLKTWLREQTHLGITDALMSGSGSTMIAFTQSNTDLHAITSSLHEAFGNTFRVHPITF